VGERGEGKEDKMERVSGHKKRGKEEPGEKGR
jgi:hypothetical protein